MAGTASGVATDTVSIRYANWLILATSPLANGVEKLGCNS